MNEYVVVFKTQISNFRVILQELFLTKKLFEIMLRIRPAPLIFLALVKLQIYNLSLNFLRFASLFEKGCREKSARDNPER